MAVGDSRGRVRRGAGHVLGEHFAQFRRIVGIAAAGVLRQAHGGFGEGSLDMLFSLGEVFIFEEAGLA